MEAVQLSADLFKDLRKGHPTDGKVLSIYLDTSTSHVVDRGYLLAYRDLAKNVRATIPAAEADPFEKAARQAEDYLTSEFVVHYPGVALFASGRSQYFYVSPLPERPVERMIWDDRPYLEPLEAAIDDYERLAVLLFDSERARLLVIHLGAIEDRQVIADEVPGKQRTGGWAALAQARYARHRDDHLLRHVQRTVSALMTTLRTNSFDRLFVGGPAEPVSLLEHHLPRPLRDRLAGRLHLELFAGDAEVVRAALDAARASERDDELKIVQELVDGETTDHVAIGLDVVLAALSEGRVHRLVVADAPRQSGAECRTCGRLAVQDGRCPTCGDLMQVIGDLRERAFERALVQGAAVEVVSGEAAEKLNAHGGLGAWTRY